MLIVSIRNDCGFRHAYFTYVGVACHAFSKGRVTCSHDKGMIP
uniref:Uncharacterized protein n=1 Tax=Arundo donax TaxID=35708 RepID=A0A0A9F4G4_ARUDO